MFVIYVSIIFYALIYIYFVMQFQASHMGIKLQQ